MNSTLPIVEIFGPTLQGEGPAAGRNAMFIRFGGCNLTCSWCDTPYSWDGKRFNLREQIHQMAVPDITARLLPAQICVITGGEPLLYQGSPGFPLLMMRLKRQYSALHLETNGTIEPTEYVIRLFDHITVSPKLPSAGHHKGRDDAWSGWHGIDQAIVKYVVEDEADVELALGRALGLGFTRDRIWVMPQGITAAELEKRWPIVAAAAAHAGINASHRLHVLAWNDERGH